MILDILIILIILVMAINGFRKGFVFTLIHSVGWVGALVLAYLLTPPISGLLKENTGLYSWLASIVRAKFDVSLDAIETASKSIPSSVALTIESTSSNLVDAVTEQFTLVFGTILVFVGLFVILKIVLWLLLRLLSKEYRDGFANFFDGLLGMVFGLLRAAIFILILMALLLPVTNLLSTGLTDFLNAQLESSVFAGSIYNENILLMLIQNYL